MTDDTFDLFSAAEPEPEYKATGSRPSPRRPGSGPWAATRRPASSAGTGCVPRRAVPRRRSALDGGRCDDTPPQAESEGRQGSVRTSTTSHGCGVARGDVECLAGRISHACERLDEQELKDSFAARRQGATVTASHARRPPAGPPSGYGCQSWWWPRTGSSARCPRPGTAEPRSRSRWRRSGRR